MKFNLLLWGLIQEAAVVADTTADVFVEIGQVTAVYIKKKKKSSAA